MVAPDRSAAVFTVVSVASRPGVSPGAVPLPELDPDRVYRVRVRDEAGLPAMVQAAPPAWWDAAVDGGVRARGAALSTAGLAVPVLAPAQGFLLHLTAED